ncbi:MULTISPECIES: KTSC domain-containing protein [Kitasatospora]|uniref:Lysyl-tRNA synthetase class 2 n=2 Tax=Kitasatospora TaxID=2063 RepID=A0ABT1J6B7_9ACTN|nr:KTSC domain-containing protein [Kitasatospora paracochleata]MCP2312983.1 lysyl-tRNA synthetase class 2 [Kitasatospora paracochleata]
MRREHLDSSCVRSAGYDPAEGELEVEFVGGSVYRYLAVPEPVYRALLAAESHGRYLNREIKGRYGYRRI